MAEYRTLAGEGQAELIIEKSRFIGYARAVSSREEADAFFAEIKTEHKTATHCVPAFALGEKRELLWASDDGEPQGTAGAPLLALFGSLDLANVCLMVVRYFGGVKLGTGGLVRAYTEAAKRAVCAAGIAVVREAVLLRYEIEYPHWDRVKNALDVAGEAVADVVYTEKVGFTVTPVVADAEKIRERIEALTSGGAVLREIRRTESVVPVRG
ncbi:MAG: IMPACT family protein [Clostridiales Family XIII bacterium]|nr:IMPACT family protein [Clostridiales Family XIII bacterium]